MAQIGRHQSGEVAGIGLLARRLRTRQSGDWRSQGGFTLIELLVVIAILSLLLSILVPSLAAAKKQAKVAVCLVNNRYISAGWQLYLHDSNETFPPYQNNMWWFYGGKHPVKMPNHTASYRPLNPYVDNALTNVSKAELFRCPADRVIPRVTDTYCTYDYFGNSYMLNTMLLYKYNVTQKDDTFTYTPVDGCVRLSDVKTQFSRVVVCGDCQWYYSVGDSAWDANFHNYDDRVVLSFLDEHAAYTQLIRGQDPTFDYSFDIYNTPPSNP